MTSPKKRVELELQELSDKLHNLIKFISTNTFDSLSNNQKTLLIAQKNTMETYINILQLRLNNWE